MNYYQILGVDTKADAKTIKNAFRKLAKKYHPDTNQGDARAEKMFKDINEAYSILSNDVKRMDYDASLRGAHQGGAGEQARSSRTNTSQRKAQQKGSFSGGFSMKFDFDDIMGAGTPIGGKRIWRNGEQEQKICCFAQCSSSYCARTESACTRKSLLPTKNMMS